MPGQGNPSLKSLWRDLNNSYTFRFFQLMFEASERDSSEDERRTHRMRKVKTITDGSQQHRKYENNIF